MKTYLKKSLSILIAAVLLATMIPTFTVQALENEFGNQYFDYDEWQANFSNDNDIFASPFNETIAFSTFDIDNDIIGLTSDLTPRYGSNGKFIAPIEPIVDYTDWTAISDRAGLEAMANNLSGKYYLTNDIDLSGAEWVPIGDQDNPFTGTFDGQGYVIHNLTITVEEYRFNGLFGYANNGMINNVGLEDTYINISSYIAFAGGICGVSFSLISNCYNTGSVSASTYAGGICGGSHSTISNCYNTGSVSTSYSAGGICSYNSYSTISNCYNTGSVSASSASDSSNAGGICGISSTTVSNCYNTGSVSASSSASYIAYAGGICGGSNSDSTISNCYNTGSVTASSSDSYAYAGGICGGSFSLISNCYNTGSVSASSSASYIAYAGGICGMSSSSSTISNCYWNIDSKQIRNGNELPNDDKKGVGEGTDTTTSLTTTQMQNPNSFVGFDFDTVWTFKNGVNNNMPILLELYDSYKPTIRVESTITATKGSTVTVPIEIYNNPGTATVTFNLSYDPNILTLLEVTAANESLPLNTQFMMTTTPGLQRISLVNEIGGQFEGDGVIAYAKFQVDMNPGVESTSLGLSFTTLPDGQPTNKDGTVFYDAITQSGDLTISLVVYGDINGDYTINGADLVLFLKYFAQEGTQIDMANSDVNGDGLINGADLILLLKYFAQDDVVLGPKS